MGLIALVKNIKLFLDSKESNLNFQNSSSFVGIHKVLREIWLSEHEFQTRNFGKLRILGVSVNCS